MLICFTIRITIQSSKLGFVISMHIQRDYIGWLIQLFVHSSLARRLSTWFKLFLIRAIRAYKKWDRPNCSMYIVISYMHFHSLNSSFRTVAAIVRMMVVNVSWYVHSTIWRSGSTTTYTRCWLLTVVKSFEHSSIWTCFRK